MSAILCMLHGRRRSFSRLGTCGAWPALLLCLYLLAPADRYAAQALQGGGDCSIKALAELDAKWESIFAPAKQCLEAAQAKSVIEIYHSVHSIPFIVKRMFDNVIPAFDAIHTHIALAIEECLLSGRRAYWVFQPKLSDNKRRHRSAICVPPTCEAQTVEEWFGAPVIWLAEHARERLPRPVYQINADWIRSTMANLAAKYERETGTCHQLAPADLAKQMQKKVAGIAQVFEHTYSRTPPRPPLSVLALAHRGTAICFGGHWRTNLRVLASVREHLVQTLAADIFGVFSGLRGRRARHRTAEQFRRFFQRTQVIQFVDDLSEEQVWEALKASGKAVFYVTLAAQMFYLGNQMHLFRKQTLCLDLIGEREAVRGMRYERIVYSRLDQIWRAAHPPLSLMDPKRVWIPCENDHGEDCAGQSGGYWDNHAVLGRIEAEIYMRRWDLLQQGTAYLLPGMDGHAFLKILLRRQFNLSLGWYPAVAGLTCCRASWGCTWPNSSMSCSADGLWRIKAENRKTFHAARNNTRLLANGATWAVDRRRPSRLRLVFSRK